MIDIVPRASRERLRIPAIRQGTVSPPWLAEAVQSARLLRI